MRRHAAGRCRRGPHGHAKAYPPDNAGAGALIHLCNAGRVVLPDGSSYHGCESNATSTGKFMTGVARIGPAGWMDRSVGAVEWYGILGEGSAVVAGRTVSSVKPVEQRDGSGFYVSPTSLADTTVTDRAVPSRYVNPLRVAAAVAPRSIAVHGAAIGSFGCHATGARQGSCRFIHAASGWLSMSCECVLTMQSRSGLRVTAPMCDQSRACCQSIAPGCARGPGGTARDEPPGCPDPRRHVAAPG